MRVRPVERAASAWPDSSLAALLEAGLADAMARGLIADAMMATSETHSKALRKLRDAAHGGSISAEHGVGHGRSPRSNSKTLGFLSGRQENYSQASR